jgi:hypothetical protein
VQFIRLFLVSGSDEDLRNIRTGYAIALFAQVLMLGTHAIWGTANAFVMVYLGIGVWIWEAGRRETVSRRRRVPAEATIARPTDWIPGERRPARRPASAQPRRASGR